VILAGILLKMGGYGLLRIALPILPDAVRLFLTPMLVLSGVAIVYGAYVTLAQTDVKRLIAYSSISHMGFVTLGIFSLDRSGIEGAILQMINHGIITGALFLCVGMIYERTHTREVAQYGGLFKVAPIYSSFLAVFCLAAAGTPGLNSFVGEFLIILGALRAGPWVAALAVWGVALGAAYVLWLFYRMVIGEVGSAVRGVRLDLDVREIATLAPLVVLAVLIGVYPESVLGVLRGSVTELLAAVAGGGGIAGRP
jgi:NADH-quinone oxidoreductase subunit M